MAFLQFTMKDLLYITLIVILSASLWVAVRDRQAMLQMIESLSTPPAIRVAPDDAHTPSSTAAPEGRRNG